MEKELGARVRDGKRTETAQKSISELEAKSGGVLIYNSAQNISLSYFQGVLIYNSAENISFSYFQLNSSKSFLVLNMFYNRYWILLINICQLGIIIKVVE